MAIAFRIECRYGVQLLEVAWLQLQFLACKINTNLPHIPKAVPTQRNTCCMQSQLEKANANLGFG